MRMPSLAERMEKLERDYAGQKARDAAVVRGIVLAIQHLAISLSQDAEAFRRCDRICEAIVALHCGGRRDVLAPFEALGRSQG